MPSYVIPDKCDGCKALDKTACQHIQPGSGNVLGMLQLREDLPDPGH